MAGATGGRKAVGAGAIRRPCRPEGRATADPEWSLAPRHPAPLQTLSACAWKRRLRAWTTRQAAEARTDLPAAASLSPHNAADPTQKNQCHTVSAERPQWPEGAHNEQKYRRRTMGFMRKRIRAIAPEGARVPVGSMLPNARGPNTARCTRGAEVWARLQACRARGRTGARPVRPFAPARPCGGPMHRTCGIHRARRLRRFRARIRPRISGRCPLADFGSVSRPRRPSQELRRYSPPPSERLDFHSGDAPVMAQ